MHLSSSSLSGTEIRNPKGDKLGKLEELMINTKTGEVDYAVVSFGGFLGIGDKLFAVPLQAMKVDTGDKKLVLNETEERLKNAPGFDKDHWPDHADSKWSQEVHSYYSL
ncbi:MAG TPA: PRC-barrel domain-containing protein [Woeseiaceae bacterium]|nr:PRC-barrel domain-containing protein [Woeseiaceae bacterium]